MSFPNQLQSLHCNTFTMHVASLMENTAASVNRKGQRISRAFLTSSLVNLSRTPSYPKRLRVEKSKLRNSAPILHGTRAMHHQVNVRQRLHL